MKPTFYNSLVRRPPGSATAFGHGRLRQVSAGAVRPSIAGEPADRPDGLQEDRARRRGGFTPGPQPHPMPRGLRPGAAADLLREPVPRLCARGRRPVGVRAAWIVNVSNDAWFGQTCGPWQHLNMASYRAIEEGLPIVRATPTGVSAVIDAYGRRCGPSASAALASSMRACPPPGCRPPHSTVRRDCLSIMVGLSAVALVPAVRRWKRIDQDRHPSGLSRG